MLLSIVGAVGDPDALVPGYDHPGRLGRVMLAAPDDGRRVITDDQAGLLAAIAGDQLVAGPDAAFVTLSTLIAGVAIEPTHDPDSIGGMAPRTTPVGRLRFS